MLVGNKLDISTDQVPGEQVALRYNIQHAVASAKTG